MSVFRDTSTGMNLEYCHRLTVNSNAIHRFILIQSFTTVTSFNSLITNQLSISNNSFVQLVLNFACTCIVCFYFSLSLSVSVSVLVYNFYGPCCLK